MDRIDEAHGGCTPTRESRIAHQVDVTVLGKVDADTPTFACRPVKDQVIEVNFNSRKPEVGTGGVKHFRTLFERCAGGELLFETNQGDLLVQLASKRSVE